jgi:hypothetical protein
VPEARSCLGHRGNSEGLADCPWAHQTPTRAPQAAPTTRSPPLTRLAGRAALRRAVVAAQFMAGIVCCELVLDV